MSIPTIRTDRLILRPFTNEDGPRVQALAGVREIASSTLTIPHPYEDGMAETWIETHSLEWHAKKSLTLAITAAGDGLIGCVSLKLAPEHRRAELGYWIGVPYWGLGYATEASAALLDYAFDQLDLNRVDAHYFARNPASGKVMRKLGMQHEGMLRQHITKWDQLEDIELYGILASEWKRKTRRRPELTADPRSLTRGQQRSGT